MRPVSPNPWPFIAAEETFFARVTSWPIRLTSASAIFFAPAAFLTSSAIFPVSVNAKSFAAPSTVLVPVTGWAEGPQPCFFASYSQYGSHGCDPEPATPPAAKCDEDDWGIPPNPGTRCAARIGAISGTKYRGIIASPGSSIAGMMSPEPEPGTMPPVWKPEDFRMPAAI